MRGVRFGSSPVDPRMKLYHDAFYLFGAALNAFGYRR
jgi:hypothetical protein